ncbi:MAG: hypothetical protein WBA76_02900 [Phormidesmis sp.]
MKPLSFIGDRLCDRTATHDQNFPTLHIALTPHGNPQREPLRHILLGSPAAIRQTIHLLHTLSYAETVLWSPILTTEEPLIITPAQGEAMSLLKRYL